MIYLSSVIYNEARYQEMKEYFVEVKVKPRLLYKECYWVAAELFGDI